MEVKTFLSSHSLLSPIHWFTCCPLINPNKMAQLIHYFQMSPFFCNPHLFGAHSYSCLSWMVSYGLSRVFPACTWSPGHSAHIELSSKLVLPSVAYYPHHQCRVAMQQQIPQAQPRNTLPLLLTQVVQGRHKTLSPQWIFSVILAELSKGKWLERQSPAIPVLRGFRSLNWMMLFQLSWSRMPLWVQTVPNPGEFPNQSYLLRGS